MSDTDDMVTGAAYRVNNIIQKITEPPETVMAHLKRIGIEPIVDTMQLDDTEPKTYVLFEYEELLEKELEAIAKGNSYSADYPKGKPVLPIKVATEPVVLDEIRRRMQTDKDRHPSQMTLDENDDWPITGENPSL